MKKTVDRKTEIDRRAITDVTGVRSVLQNSSYGCLFARQLNAELDNWNLALFGQFQRPTHSDSVDRLTWVAIDFRCTDGMSQPGFSSLFLYPTRSMLTNPPRP